MSAGSVLAPFAALLNRNVAASTPARALLESLRGRSVALEVGAAPGPALVRLRLAAGDAGLALTRDDEPADAAVSGTPGALLGLLAGRAQGAAHAAGVAVAGDAEVAQGFERLVRHARPDLEEELARHVGDLPAHFAARALRGAFGFAARARDSLARSLGEYLTEERRELVPRAELEALLGDVDRVREDVDRAEARLALLERARAARA
jgi:ubiquinone biosynthesis protein UbiJ